MTLFDDRGDPTIEHTTTGHDHPDTSHEAARRILPKTGTQRRKVLSVVGIAPLTDEEIGELLKMNPSSVRPRRGELVTMGWLEDSGQRRLTESGAKAIVWQVRP